MVTTAGSIRSLLELVLSSRITGLGTIKTENRKWLHHIAIFRMELFLLGRSRSGVGAGVGVDIFRPESESELESPEIRRLRSPVWRP